MAGDSHVVIWCVLVTGDSHIVILCVFVVIHM